MTNYCQSVARVNGVPIGGGGSGGGSVPTPILPGNILIGNLGGTALEYIPASMVVEGLTQFWADAAARAAAGSTGFSDGELGVQRDTGDVYEFVDPTHSGTGVWTLRYNINDGLPKDNYIAVVPPTVNDDNTLGYSVGSEWIDVVTGFVYQMVSSATGAAVWRLSGSTDTVQAQRAGVDISFFDASNAYVSISSPTVTVLAAFKYNGTNKFTPSAFTVIADRAGTNGTTEIVLYDATNSQEIARVSVSTAARAIHQDLSLANLPATEAIFEVRGFKSFPPASAGHLFYTSLR